MYPSTIKQERNTTCSRSLQFGALYLDGLSQEADKSSRKRQHSNIHASYQDPCQRLFNAIAVDSYIPPHRHLLDPKKETLIAVRGLFALILFNETGVIIDTIKFGSEKYASSEDLASGVELLSGSWHTVVALVPGSILFEVKAGPFNPEQAKELAPWAPKEGSEESVLYLKNLHIITHEDKMGCR